MRVFTCADCKKEFTINHGGPLPKRCKVCRPSHDYEMFKKREARYRARKGQQVGQRPRNINSEYRRNLLAKALRKHGLTWKGMDHE